MGADHNISKSEFQSEAQNGGWRQSATAENSPVERSLCALAVAYCGCTISAQDGKGKTIGFARPRPESAGLSIASVERSLCVLAVAYCGCAISAQDGKGKTIGFARLRPESAGLSIASVERSLLTPNVAHYSRTTPAQEDRVKVIGVTWLRPAPVEHSFTPAERNFTRTQHSFEPEKRSLAPADHSLSPAERSLVPAGDSCNIANFCLRGHRAHIFVCVGADADGCTFYRSPLADVPAALTKEQPTIVSADGYAALFSWPVNLFESMVLPELFAPGLFSSGPFVGFREGVHSIRGVFVTAGYAAGRCDELPKQAGLSTVRSERAMSDAIRATSPTIAGEFAELSESVIPISGNGHRSGKEFPEGRAGRNAQRFSRLRSIVSQPRAAALHYSTIAMLRSNSCSCAPHAKQRPATHQSGRTPMSHSINPADVNFRTQNFRTHDPGKHNLKSATRTGNERNADCRAIENTGPSLALHNLVLTEVFHARAEALTVTELFQRTHGRFTVSGLLEFTRAVVWLEEEGLLEPVFPQELAGSKEKAERHFSESTSKQVAAGGGCAPLLKDNCGPQPKDICAPQPNDICASRQSTERCIKSAITAKGEMYLFGQTQPGAAAVHSSKATTLHNSAKSEIADGLTLVAEPTSQHMVEQTLEPAPEAPDGNGGDAAPKLTSPLASSRTHRVRLRRSIQTLKLLSSNNSFQKFSAQRGGWKMCATAESWRIAHVHAGHASATTISMTVTETWPAETTPDSARSAWT